MQHTTLLFLVKKNGGEITHVCLAMKKRSFGVGKWNGVGGKLDEGESVEDAVIRETKEEIDVNPINFTKVAELEFSFVHKREWDQIVNVYMCDAWAGDPNETEEMNPKWFAVEELPYTQMWPSDMLWLPKLLDGDLLKGSFALDQDDSVVNHKVESVESV